MHCIKGVGLYQWTVLQNARIKREKPCLSKTSILKQSCSIRRDKSKNIYIGYNIATP